jgi:uncharacterized protein
VGVVAIGNGTACRETEELIAEIIAEGVQFSQNPEAAQAAAAADAEAAPAPSPDHAHAAAPAEAPPSPEATEAPAGEPAPVEPAAEAGAGADAVAPAGEAAPAPAAAEGAEADPGNNGAAEPVEALPPISGGAPDEAAAVEETSGSPPAEPAPGEATASAPDSSPVPEPAPAADVPPAAEATAAAEPPVASGPVDSAAGAPADAVAATPTETAGLTAEAPAPTPAPAPAPATAPTRPAEGRPPKANKSEPRPPRPKQPPAPPRPHPADALLAQLAYVIVNEAGASVYSTSPVGREEFPDFDPTLRGTVSIGRRLEDPLSELVKIEPQNIGVGLYQHDVNAKQLKESLESVIASCVNFVGVDLNTASVPLLRHVSGLNQLTARRIVEHRKEKGPFTSREQLMQVEGVGPATFTQAAGFLKIREGEHPLDRTWIHPESYAVATRLLETLGFAPDVVTHKDQLPALHEKLGAADLPALARELEVGEPTLRDICDALARPDRDPREDLPKPIFKKGVLKLEDLQPGMELKGTVLNVVDFGAFVDIGLKDSGLVHISQLANRYIKSPHDVVSVGDVVTVWVMGVDHERKRVSLTMVKPGTERPRGQQGGGGGGRRGGPQGEGQQQPQRERRGGGPGRPPRREPAPPSQLTGPPVGGQPVTATGGESGGRRYDQRPRPEGGGRPGQGGPGRGPRPQYGGPGQGRAERAQAPRQPTPPRKPAPPPPPLSKDALTGSVPLRTFGQLKQLWQARESDTEGEGEPKPEGAAPATTPEPTPPPAPENPPAPEQSGS